MGYFELVRELRSAAAAEAEEAKAAADAIESHEALAALAWTRVTDPGFVDKVYRAVAERDPSLALGLERASRLDDESLQVFNAEGLGALLPWLVSRIHTVHKQQALTILLGVWRTLDRELPGLEELAGVDDRVAFLAAALLASLPFDATRDFVASRIGDPWPEESCLYLRLRLAEAGHPSQDAWLLDRVHQLAETRRTRPAKNLAAGERRHVRREEDDPTAKILRRVGLRKLQDAVPGLCELLYGSEGIAALGALGEIGDPSAAPVIERYLASLAGDVASNAPYRLAAENALSALGSPQPLDTAHFVLSSLPPKRYGYPKWKHLHELYELAGLALLERGETDDLEVLRLFVEHETAELRELARQAWTKLGAAPPALQYYDPPRVKAWLAESGPKPLLAALTQPGAVFRHNLVRALSDFDDAQVARELAELSRDELEAMPHFDAQSSDTTGALPSAMLRHLTRGLDEETQRELLHESPSRWIQSFVFSDSKPIPTLPTSEVGEGIALTTERFDSTAPFTIGSHVNGLARSPDGKQLAVLGADFCKLLDAETGAHRQQLIPGWSWAYGCAFSPDSETLLASFHAGHVEAYDVATGERRREYPGHGGVPGGVKRLALSADGTVLATAGSDARVMANRVGGERLWVHQGPAGSYEAVAFTPEQTQIVASHVKTSGGEENFLTVHDVDSGEVQRVDMPSSMWAIAYAPDGERVALGGEGDAVLLCDRAFTAQVELDLGNVTKLDYSSDGRWLYAASELGVLKRFAADGSDPAGECLLEGVSALFALLVTPDTIYCAGKDGNLYRFDPDGKRIEVEGTPSHREQVRLLRRDGDSIYSGSWDGQLIRWPLAGETGELVFDAESRIASGELRDGRALLGTGGGLCVVSLADGALLTSIEGKRVDALAVTAGGLLVSQGSAYLRLSVDATAFPEERTTAGTDSLECILELPGGDLLVSSEGGEVSRFRDDTPLWTIVDHGEDKLEYGSPHNAVFDMLLIRDGFVSAANDKTVRVYRMDGDDPPVLLKRIFCPGLGIFNRLALSADERWLAVPTGSRLDVFALPSAERRVSLASLEHFACSATSSALWLDAETVLVGTENGSLYRIYMKGLNA